MSTPFRVVYDALSDHHLAPAIATLAEAWQKHQAELQADEAADKRPIKRPRRRQGRRTAKVLSLVPKREAEDPPIRSNEATRETPNRMADLLLL